MDGSIKVGHTYSSSGEYGINEITILMLRSLELAKGDLVFIEHPKKRAASRLPSNKSLPP